MTNWRYTHLPSSQLPGATLMSLHLKSPNGGL